MNYLQLSQRDEDALFEYIEGENDALTLEIPASDDYHYLMGWRETKAKVASGELTMETIERDLTNKDECNEDIF